MICTVHQAGPYHTFERLRGRLRIKSTNGRKIQRMLDENSAKLLPTSKIIDDYNHFMAGLISLISYMLIALRT